MRYVVYTLRRTSSRTSYAIYDTLASQPVMRHKGEYGSPWSTTDKDKARANAKAMNRQAS